MKCIYCGKELQPDNVYCPHCGKAVQIVPDYSMYDDDYLKEVLTEQNPSGSRTSGDGGIRRPAPDSAAKVAVEAEQENPEHKKAQKKKKIKIIAGVTATGFVLIFAILVFSAAIRSNHNNSYDYQVKMAREALLDGNLDQACTYYKRAVELDPGSTEAMLALADLYMKQKDYASAEPLYKEIIRDDKKNRDAFKNLIVIYELENNTDAVMSLSKIADDSLSDLFAAYQTEVPLFGLTEGTYDSPQKLQLSSAQGNQIYYTMDGSDPETKGVLYVNPIDLAENNRNYTIKAVCLNEKKVYSDTVTKNYRIEIPAPDMPTVSPDGGNFTAPTTVTVEVPVGCSAYYTWDGSTPDKGSNRYSQPIEVPEGNNILSVILYDNSTGLGSQVYRSNFIYYAQDAPTENLTGEDSPETDE